MKLETLFSLYPPLRPDSDFHVQTYQRFIDHYRTARQVLLVEGGRSSVGQLREKLVAIFGTERNLAWLRKMTDGMYNYRSRMVHGNRQLRSAFRVYEEEQSQTRFYEEYDSARFAVGILLMLLQEVINSGQTELRFRVVRA